MDERQESGATDSHLPATKYVRRLRRTASYRNNCFAARSWRSMSASLLGRVFWPASLLERRTREFHCVVFIFGSGEIRVLHQSDQLDVDVFKTFQRHLDRLADHTRRQRILRLLVRGFEHPNAPRWHPVPRQWNEDADGGRHCERAVPTAASRWVLAAGRGTQLAHKVQFQVSSFLQAGVDSSGLGVDRMLLRDEEPAATVVLDARLRVADVVPLRLATVECMQHARGLQESDGGSPPMKSVLHAEVLAALRRVASVVRVRLEGRGSWSSGLDAGGEVVLKQHNLLEGSLLLQLGVRDEVGRHLVNQGRTVHMLRVAVACFASSR